MKDKKSIILLSLIFFSSVLIYITPTRAIIKDQTITTVAEKDSYVSSYYPTSNYGGASWLIFGNYILGWNEAYLFFNFSDKPTNWENAEISIDMYSVSETFNVTVSLINDTWDEYTINWLNKPLHREIITTFTVAEGKIYKINITDYIAGRNNISICLNASNYLQNGYVQGHSREGAYSNEDYPQLIWTYPTNVEITVTNPTSSSNWEEISIREIQWTSTGDIEDVKIELYKGATFVEEITDLFGYTTNDGLYDFYVSSAENYDGTDYRIKITDYNDPNVYGYSDYFSINVRSGTITITSPRGSSLWQAGTIQSITWTSTGNILNVDIEIYKGTVLVYYIYDVSNFGVKLWDIDEDIETGTDWKVKISNSDNSGQFDWSYNFEITSAGEGGVIPGYSFYIILAVLMISFVIIIRRFKMDRRW